MNIWAIVTPEFTAGVSEKMELVATASDHLGKCFCMGYLVEATAIELHA